MANFNEVATNQDMLNIANAIRAVTRTTGGMTIPEMPERLWNIRVVQTIVKTITVEQATTSLMLGVFDVKIKHLFIVTPLNTQDAVALAKAKANLPLSIVQTEGDGNPLVNISLETVKAIPQGTQLQFRIIDLLLPSDEATAGFIVNASTGSGGKAELYDAEASYEVGDTFLLNGNLGVTTVDHGAEPFNPQHNEVLATTDDIEIEVPLNTDGTISDDSLALITKYGEHTYLMNSNIRYNFVTKETGKKNFIKYSNIENGVSRTITVWTDNKTWMEQHNYLAEKPDMNGVFKLYNNQWVAIESSYGAFKQVVTYDHFVNNYNQYTILPLSLSLRMWAECSVGAFEETANDITFYAQTKPTDDLSFNIKHEQVKYSEV